MNEALASLISALAKDPQVIAMREAVRPLISDPGAYATMITLAVPMLQMQIKQGRQDRSPSYQRGLADAVKAMQGNLNREIVEITANTTQLRVFQKAMGTAMEAEFGPDAFSQLMTELVGLNFNEILLKLNDRVTWLQRQANYFTSVYAGGHLCCEMAVPGE